MIGLSQTVDDILEGLRQPEWRVPLDMTQSNKLADEVKSLRAERDAALAKLEEVRGDYADQEASFDLRWKADMRGIEKWRAVNPGKELEQPDHADLVCHLMDRLDFANTFTTFLQNSLKSIESERDAARASLAEALRVIEPFANRFEVLTSGEYILVAQLGSKHYVSVGATVEDCRRAAAFLAKNQPDHNPTEPGDAT